METLNDNKKLIELLDKAEKLASEFSGGYNAQFLHAEEFYMNLKESIYKLKQDDKTQLEILQFWFGPTCAWDTFVGREGQELANEITDILTKLTRQK